jgi:hypothetical protein
MCKQVSAAGQMHTRMRCRGSRILTVIGGGAVAPTAPGSASAHLRPSPHPAATPPPQATRCVERRWSSSHRFAAWDTRLSKLTEDRDTELKPHCRSLTLHRHQSTTAHTKLKSRAAISSAIVSQNPTTPVHLRLW